MLEWASPSREKSRITASPLKKSGMPPSILCSASASAGGSLACSMATVAPSVVLRNSIRRAGAEADMEGSFFKIKEVY